MTLEDINVFQVKPLEGRLNRVKNMLKPYELSV